MNAKEVIEKYIAATEIQDQFPYASKEQLKDLLKDEALINALDKLACIAVANVEKELPASEGWSWKNAPKNVAITSVLSAVFNGDIYALRERS